MKTAIFNAKYRLIINHQQGYTSIKLNKSYIMKSIRLKTTKYSEIMRFIKDWNLLELEEQDFLKILNEYNE